MQLHVAAWLSFRSLLKNIHVLMKHMCLVTFQYSLMCIFFLQDLSMLYSSYAYRIFSVAYPFDSVQLAPLNTVSKTLFIFIFFNCYFRWLVALAKRNYVYFFYLFETKRESWSLTLAIYRHSCLQRLGVQLEIEIWVWCLGNER